MAQICRTCVLLLQAESAKGHPTTPKGATTEPKASHIEAMCRPLFTTCFSQAAGKVPRPPKVTSTMAKWPQMRPSDMENELKSCQKPVITEILMSYPASKDYRNQAYRLSYPNAKNIEVRRCRVSVLKIHIYIYISAAPRSEVAGHAK